MRSKRNSSKICTPSEYFLNEMDDIRDACATLLSMFHARGLKYSEINRFVSDIINIVEYGGFFTATSVNHALESLGWPEQVITEVSLELIMEVLESIFEYQVEVHTVH